MIFRFIKFLIRSAIYIAAFAWVIGFSSFVGQVTSYTQPEININLMGTQAIVVLTGGTERLKAGVDLLKAGKGEKLLITGVNPSVKSVSTLVHEDLSDEEKDCCVTLGYAANDTIGNAEETRLFMKENDYRSLMLVTAHYHMPRSLLIFKKEMSDVKIIPYPVSPDSVNLQGWWQHTGTTMLLVVEYSKYAMAWLSAL